MILFSILVWYAIMLVDWSPESAQTSKLLVSDFYCIYWGIVFSIHRNVTLSHISLKLTYHSLYWYYWHNDFIRWLITFSLKFSDWTSLSIYLFSSFSAVTSNILKRWLNLRYYLLIISPIFSIKYFKRSEYSLWGAMIFLNSSVISFFFFNTLLEIFLLFLFLYISNINWDSS
jgi:hypothetical protein